MVRVGLSYSQSLRVIGQSLEVLDIQNFDLHRLDDWYIVYLEHSQGPGKVPLEKNFLTSIAQIIWGSDDPNQKAEPLVYTRSDIVRLDFQERSERRRAASMPDSYRLSHALRVVGDFLDRKQTARFTVSRWGNSVSVNYDTKRDLQVRENFTMDNLYELAAHMLEQRHLRSSERPGFRD